jgi:Fe-S-cluster-containing dehydrogenase component/DMSO reductase anchor subunit
MTMSEGFIFNHNKCVGCMACNAACILENKWSFAARKVYSINSMTLSALPLINISLACNHCKTAVCLDGCPSSAYFRDDSTGAVIIDDLKCLGCRYCQWNCPYDAPKFIVSEQVIGKCNFCYSLLSDGIAPACTTACPTGALGYGNFETAQILSSISWFPEKKLEPALHLTGKDNPPLRIFPQHLFEHEVEKPEEEPRNACEWSLIAFSFLTTLSVAETISSLISGSFDGMPGSLLIIVLAAVFSLFHLGKKKRVWRAVVNIKSSPLSREIALFILYSFLTGAAVILQLPMLLVVSSITGLALLLAIDAVYIFSDKRRLVVLHSGQTFISALMMVSFITGSILPFSFVAFIRLASSVNSLRFNRNDRLKFGMRFIRSALIVITGASLISKISYPETAVFILFFIGELIDRILFYSDFNPVNISKLTNNHFIEPGI